MDRQNVLRALRRLLLATLLVGGVATSLVRPGPPVPVPSVQLFDKSGNPCNGCKLYAFTAGTSTPLNTYSEVTLNAKHTHPIVLDKAGRARVFLSPASYQFRLDSAADVTIWP